MLGDLVAHSGHQFVYGWYLRHTMCAKILLWLMGLTEGLDCQRIVSPHFSFRPSEVRPALPYYNPTSLFCRHVSGDGVLWKTKAWWRVSISISHSDKSGSLITQRPWITCS